MVVDSAQIRRRGALDFLAYYDFACARQESVPLPAITMNLDRGMLDFNGDRIKLSDWPPILDSIAINKQLHHIAISSSYQSLGSGDADRRFYRSSMKRKIPAIRSKDIVFKLSKALRDCLSVSPHLKTLQLNGLPLRERDLIALTKGFAKSVSLENLSLANCPISDEGLEVICQSVKYSTSIRTIDFTGCNLTWRGAEHMANIVKHQGMQRHGTAWAESLRYRLPHFERMTGLRRVTLNCNTLIGDRGATALANELAEDLWVKAVDLQKCGLSNEGARRLLETLKTNSTLSVLDIRCNPLIDKVLIKTIIEKVLMNADGESPEYNWIKPAAMEPQRAVGLKRRLMPASFRAKSMLRNGTWKASVTGGSRVTPQKPCSRSRYIPWRTAARAGRQRGLPPGATAVEQSFQGAATVKVTIETDSEEDDGEEDEVIVEVEEKPSSSAAHGKITERQFGRLQMELRECRLMLAEERRARLKAETRLKESELENARLRTTNLSLSETLAHSALAPAAFSALEDEAVLDSIENSFKKFHAFLDLLRDAGLGQLVSMAGLEKTDFQPIGKPQLSSTIGPRNHQVNQYGGMPAMSDPTVEAPSPPPIAQAVVILPKSSSSSMTSLHGDRQLDVTFTQLARRHEVPEVSGEGNKDHYSKHVRKPSSDRSVSSQKSSECASLRKNYQAQPSRSPTRSESPHCDSHRDLGSHGYSDSSQGRLSSRSSISEVISERGGSVSSWVSKGRERVKLGFGDRLGSGGSVSSENDREDILKQVPTLSGMGVQSFSSLF
uniref:Centrosomal protein 78 n=1 Tax=Neogobius melanostomus TaxID=47308 RepID=A0A8C6USS0_9GOBI